MMRNPASRTAAAAEHGRGLRGRPANLRRLGDRIDEDHQGGGDGDRSEGIVAPPSLRSRLSGTILGARASATTPIGTLNKKMYCHPA